MATKILSAIPSAGAAVFVALAHPVRRQILQLLRAHPEAQSAGQLAAQFRHTWPTTTRHLHVLERAGLIRHERRGRSRVYHLALSRLAVVEDWLRGLKRGSRRDDA